MSSGQAVGPLNSGRGNEPDDQLLKLPEKLHQRLMPFQREGVRFALSRDGRCMIADEMGLGKTLQAIAVACAYRQDWPLLIVVPSSLKYPWIEELEKWIPELDPEDINLVENKADIEGISRSLVTVLGYGLLTSDAHALVSALTQRDFGVVLVDESHYLKSRQAARTRLLVPLIRKAQRALLLTGTPALGRPEELFMQIDALYPRQFGTWSEYAKQYCNAHYRFFGSRRQWDCRGASHLDELHRRLAEVMIRRLKAQVLTQLPPKIRQRIPFDLPKDGAKEASASFEEWQKLMGVLASGAPHSEKDPFVEVMGLITRMYKQTAIAKAGAVKDYIKMMLENKELKFLVFAHHLTMLQACTEAVIEAKARYIRIDGSVPSSERIRLVHQFQSDPVTRVAILSIQAAGQGLTFTAASHVVFAELYWNPGHVKQAEDRAHRIGQSRSVHVHYLIAKGTFDTVMWAMLNRKETITGSTLNGRKEYLNAEVGDKEKWEFLNFASMWTPSGAVEGVPTNHKDEGVFFSHLEKDRQHDIRSFFSPSSAKEKRRRKPSGEQAEPDACTDTSDEEFAPQCKRLRRIRWPSSLPSGPCWPSTGPPQAAPTSHSGEWNCSSCTYANSDLLPYCEMCEASRPCTAVPVPKGTRRPCLARSAVDGGDPRLSPGASNTDGEPEQQDEGHTGGEPEHEDVDLEPEEEETPHPYGQAGCRSPQLADGTVRESSSGLPVYEGLKFRASRNTDRIYIYSKEGSPLNCNFIPMDIKLDTWDDLPQQFSCWENRLQVLCFVRGWTSLSAMKQRVIRRSGRLFQSSMLLLEELTSDQRRRSITKRFLTKEDVAHASLSKARIESGTIRHVTSETSTRRTSAQLTSMSPDRADPQERGFLQALDSAGTPLCLSCQAPCRPGGAWDGRFCQQRCREDFQTRSSGAYVRTRVLEAEHGVCQHCGLNAHQLFTRVRDAPPAHRKEMLEGTWLAQLPLKLLNEIIRSPTEGQFWQADHIRPVYQGGGQCSLDNLQTLCTVCHRERTAQQAKERSQMKRGVAAGKLASDITKFFIKK
uniref:Zinc finger RANBP2-type containing 3 n=1 Tax=Paramormyrops kingsleyae TaxID=1676925 RepID=A0A3B3SJH1_9TELE|nr:DNA annealing helicase and endonuclease ZRANB3 isoform X2 [Paramormyrops kingsleyae]XP_023677387.1 DNA annealing helicase and endonuclease ZRANB3 isoform X2 [Paramormyrops kingsleyae]XP_023677388.1 DNA annealing helicase and endonuclease ZRANB3 isoform X2 [Paramormyrops kingsleyae]XP_023677389.1 DNA annealing helicase and endonuclease ZRANB3 isoform X2 [Paramormyrops kingsleyae]